MRVCDSDDGDVGEQGGREEQWKKGWMRIVNRRVEIPIRKIERRVSREPETWRTLNLAAHRSGTLGPGVGRIGGRKTEWVNRGRNGEMYKTSNRTSFREMSFRGSNPLFSLI